MGSNMQIAAEVAEPACPESDIYNTLLSLDDCNIVELGGGAAELTREIATGGKNRSVSRANYVFCKRDAIFQVLRRFHLDDDA